MAQTGNTSETAMPETARLILEGKEYRLPIVRGTEGERAVDISSLRKTTGYVTLDKGYENTGSCRERHHLHRRGKGDPPLPRVPDRGACGEIHVHRGCLPPFVRRAAHNEQLEEFSTFLNESSLIHEDMLHFFVGFPRGSHPMGILATTVASLSTFYPIPDDLNENAERQILANLISQVRTIAAISYKKSIGEPIVYPSYQLRYVPNFLNMMFSSPSRRR